MYITIDTIYCSMIFCYVIVLLTAAPKNIFHWDEDLPLILDENTSHVPFLLNAP